MLMQIFKSKAHRAAEAKVEGFRKNLGPFVAATDATRMPTVFTDARAPGEPILFANDSFLALLGFERAAISQRILYYRVSYRTANNTVLTAGPLISVVVP
jgi:hypothetical protein